ncbi:peroxidase family protein [Jiella sp. M17.18]|uniref:peroxidase family protein n=1 Tax=Jiella sp. M17.18 TaxID=3234247 RepID=UPI0034DE1AD9
MSQSFHGLTRVDHLVKESLDGRAASLPFPNVFGRLLPENPLTGALSPQTVADAYIALADSMKTSSPSDGHADAGMTFFGQFVDHDITLDAQSAIGTTLDPRSIRNVRTPALDLDNIYGDGPDGSPHIYSEKYDGYLLFGRKDNPSDLARNDRGRALIGDPRNDENIIVSQIQGAFICLHNILMSQVENQQTTRSDVHDCATMNIRSDVWQDVVPPHLMTFEQVRRFIRLHYQYLVLHDLLPAFVAQSVIDSALAHDPFHDLGPIMPVEFSGAAYRFGHATVRPQYTLKNGHAVDLFAMRGFERRTGEADIAFDQFFAINGSTPQKATPIGPHMAPSLYELPFVTKTIKFLGLDLGVAQAKKLALRNILRDRGTYLLPSGQQVARHLRIAELPPPKALTDHHVSKTPLWYYCLQEAGEQGGGRLTGVGGAIVASVLIRILKLDPESVLHVPDFKPWSGFGGNGMTLGKIMAFVDRHRAEVAHADELTSG